MYGDELLHNRLFCAVTPSSYPRRAWAGALTRGGSRLSTMRARLGAAAALPRTRSCDRAAAGGAPRGMREQQVRWPWDAGGGRGAAASTSPGAGSCPDPHATDRRVHTLAPCPAEARRRLFNASDGESWSPPLLHDPGSTPDVTQPISQGPSTLSPPQAATRQQEAAPTAAATR
jgi:hypothetical protein